MPTNVENSLIGPGRRICDPGLLNFWSRVNERECRLVVAERDAGLCARCGKPLDEERLKAMPTAKYDAACQAAIDEARGLKKAATL